MWVTGRTLCSLRRRPTEQGELAKRALSAGQAGYPLASADATTSSGVGHPAGMEDSSQALFGGMSDRLSSFEMSGSLNFVRFLYDGDLSDSDRPESGAQEGSA